MDRDNKHCDTSCLFNSPFPRDLRVRLAHLASVVQKVDNAIQLINHYPADKHWQNQWSYSMDSDLSSG